MYPKEKVCEEEEKQDAIPYDMRGAEYSHYGDKCTFDYIVKKLDLRDEAAHQIARIVRGADTHWFDIAEQAAGLGQFLQAFSKL